MKKAGIISIFLAFLVIACSIATVIPISADSNQPQKSWIRGDTDGDGEVSILDATCIQRELASLPNKSYYEENADADEDGEVTILDATGIQRYLASLPYEGRIGNVIAQPTTEITAPLFVVETVNAAAGDQNVAVNVFVKNNPGVAAIALDVSYDKDKLELTGFAYNTAALGGASTTPYSSTAKVPCLFMVNGTSNVNGDFTFASMYFNVNSNASGSCPISVSYDEDNVYDISEENIAFEIINGAIIIDSNDSTEPIQSNNHTVVFKDYNGTVLSTQTVKDGDSAVAPANPERNGYTFAGWSTAFDDVKSDLEIMALYNEANTNPTFVIDKVYANSGNKNIAVTVMVKNNPGIAAIALDIMYDKSALTLTGFTYNTEALAGASTTPFNANAYQPCLFMVNGTKNVEGDFLFSTMYFDVADGIFGTYPISVVYDEDNVYNIDEDNVAFDVTNGFINIS